MVKLHHLRIGRSIFTVWILEELGANYEIEVYHRGEDMRAPKELKDVHPLGKSPVIEDEGLVLAESGAINSYLMAKYDSDYLLHPKMTDLKKWAEYQQWLAYPEGSVFAPLLIKILLLRSGADHPAAGPFSAGEIKLHLDHIANHLRDNEFMFEAGFSGVDFGITYVISMAERLGQLDGYPSLQAYLQRMTSRPAFVRAVDKAVE